MSGVATLAAPIGVKKEARPAASVFAVSVLLRQFRVTPAPCDKLSLVSVQLEKSSITSAFATGLFTASRTVIIISPAGSGVPPSEADQVDEGGNSGMSGVGYKGGSDAGHTGPGEKRDQYGRSHRVPPVEESRADPWTGFHRSVEGGNRLSSSPTGTVHSESRGMGELLVRSQHQTRPADR